MTQNATSHSRSEAGSQPKSNDKLQDFEVKKDAFLQALSFLSSSFINPNAISQVFHKHPHYGVLLECFTFGFALAEKVSHIKGQAADLTQTEGRSKDT